MHCVLERHYYFTCIGIKMDLLKNCIVIVYCYNLKILCHEFISQETPFRCFKLHIVKCLGRKLQTCRIYFMKHEKSFLQHRSDSIRGTDYIAT